MIHHRKTPRAQWYDYGSAGCYFVTIVTKERVCYFGDICRDDLVDRSIMQLNSLGQYCHDEIVRLSERKTVDVHAFVVMPNHVYILLVMDTFTESMNEGYRRDNIGNNMVCRDGLVDRPNDDNLKKGHAESMSLPSNELGGIMKYDNYQGPLLGQIVNVFKGNVSKYAKANDIPFTWQGRYHDRIVRDEAAYENITYYIQTNVENRGKDDWYEMI